MVRRKSRYSRKLRNTRRLVKHSKGKQLHKRKPKQSKRKYTRKYKNVVIRPSKRSRTSKRSRNHRTHYMKRFRGGDLNETKLNSFSENSTPKLEQYTPKEQQYEMKTLSPFGSRQNEVISKPNLNEKVNKIQEQKQETQLENTLMKSKTKKTGLQHLKEGLKKLFDF